METVFCVIKSDECFEFVRAKFFYRKDAEFFAKMLGGDYRVVEM